MDEKYYESSQKNVMLHNLMIYVKNSKLDNHQIWERQFSIRYRISTVLQIYTVHNVSDCKVHSVFHYVQRSYRQIDPEKESKLTVLLSNIMKASGDMASSSVMLTR